MNLSCFFYLNGMIYSINKMNAYRIQFKFQINFFFRSNRKNLSTKYKIRPIGAKKKKTTAKITWLTLVFESNSTSEN